MGLRLLPLLQIRSTLPLLSPEIPLLLLWLGLRLCLRLRRLPHLLLPLLEIRSALLPTGIPLLLWLLRLRLCLRLRRLPHLLLPLLEVRSALLPAGIPLLLRLCLWLLLSLLEVRSALLSADILPALLLRSEIRPSLLDLPWPRSFRLSVPRVRLNACCAAAALGPYCNTRHLRRHPVFRDDRPRSDCLRRPAMVRAVELLPVA